MYLALSIVHLMMCFILILIVLLQSGKGAQMGSAFGSGASRTIFGTRGTATFLNKLTTVAAIVFMLTSLSLAIIASQRFGTSVVREETSPASQAPAPMTSPDKSPTSPAAPASPARH